LLSPLLPVIVSIIASINGLQLFASLGDRKWHLNDIVIVFAARVFADNFRLSTSFLIADNDVR
jgi:hypothetical protein